VRQLWQGFLRRPVSALAVVYNCCNLDGTNITTALIDSVERATYLVRMSDPRRRHDLLIR
jgi:hypothetical protein